MRPVPGRRAAALAAAASALLLLAAPLGAQGSGSPEVRLEADGRSWGVPRRAEVRLSAPAHVAVFEIRPGRGAVMLWPTRRREAGRLEAGRHAVPLAGARFGFPEGRGLPSPDFPVPGRVRHLFRPYLLAVASRRPLWLTGHYHGRLFQPRQVFPSVGTMVNALLEEVLAHPRSGGWSFDLVPAFPARYGPHPFGSPDPFRRPTPR